MPRPVARFASARKANVSAIFALAFPVAIGSAAFSMETCCWCYEQHQLQVAAAAAANAASLGNHNGADTPAIEAVAVDAAIQSGFDPRLGTITVQDPPPSSAYANSSAAVNVVITQRARRLFTQMFSNTPAVIRTSATAVFRTTDACMLALDPTAAQAADFSGGSTLTLRGCAAMSDSDAADAVYVSGGSSLTASCVVSAGGVRRNGRITDTACPAPVPNAQPAPDPYAKVPQPSTSGPCLTASGGVLHPGIYCSSVSLAGDVTLEPGTYVFEGGLTIKGGATVTGTGVTLFTFGSSGVSVNGDATVHLRAPTSGTYSGILFFGDRSVTGVTNRFNGKAGSAMTGVIYFPSQNVTYLGRFSGAHGCTQIVADTVSWRGDASFNADCSAYGMSPIPVLASVKLVG